MLLAVTVLVNRAIGLKPAEPDMETVGTRGAGQLISID
jgi:hypothetical protein